MSFLRPLSPSFLIAARWGESEVASCTTIEAVMYGITPSAIRLMRLSEPPEKVLKKSSTPPRVVSNRVASARGSTPGSGTWLDRRNTISASVALAKLARLTLAARFSAAEAMCSCVPD